MKYLLSLAATVLFFFYFISVSRGSGRIVKLIYFELLYNLMIKFLIGSLGLPSMFNYVTDVVWVWIVVEFLYQRKRVHRKIPASLTACGILFFLGTLISYAMNLYSPLLYLWGFRNHFRFILFAMMCAVFLRKRDIQTIMDIFFGFFVLNLFVVTYQYFFVTYSESAIGDFISGLFSNGTERGGNASLDWLMCIVSTYSIVKYLNEKASPKKMLFCLFGSIYMAALGEIKIYFVQMVLIGILAVAICRKSFKIFAFVLAGTLCVTLGIQALYIAFPKFAGFFTLQNMIAYVTNAGGYSSRGHNIGIDRATVFTYVFRHFLTDLPGRMHGIGLGNADFSSFPALTSSFYRNYSWSGYTFFSSSFILIETGSVGLTLYLMYFANYVRYAIEKLRMKQAMPKGYESVLHTAVLIGLMCFLMIFSNQTMKMETSAYMVHCILVLPFVLYRRDDQSGVGESMVLLSGKGGRHEAKGFCDCPGL